MEDNRIELEEDHEDFEEDEDEEDEADFEEDEEEEEVEDLEDEDEDEEEEDYEEEEDVDSVEEDEEDSEDEEIEELIPVEMTSPHVSSSISDGTNLLGALAINDNLLDNSKSCEGKPGNQENSGSDRGKESLNRGEIDGLFCPICFEAWTSSGEHQICCLPCGHIYGLSCINKWLQRSPSSRKCPQCKRLCKLKDVRVLYAARLCVADEELHKRVRSLEAECAYLKQKSVSERMFEEMFKKLEAKVADIHGTFADIDGKLGEMHEQTREQMDAIVKMLTEMQNVKRI